MALLCRTTNLRHSFRVLNPLGIRHATKLCYKNCASVAVPLRYKRAVTSLSQTQSVEIIRSVTCDHDGAKNSRLFSSDSSDTTFDDERRKFENDPEIQAWMSQMALDERRKFENDPEIQASMSQMALDDERRKFENDPEIQAWIIQMAQDFETPPFPALVDTPPTDTQDTHVSHDRSASDEGVASSQATSDIEVEDFGYIEDDEDDFVDPVPEKDLPVSLQRGQFGVFDVEEVVAVLEDDNGVDIQVIDIPPEARFVDHMVVVSGKSLRHMRAMAASIEWMYKRKKQGSDRQFRLEGRECTDWFAMDLGNIAVHIFMPKAREHYDLETLWTLGPEHDNQRHYVHDDSLNLSEADLFWLESGSHQASSPQAAEDSKTFKAGGREGNMVHTTDQSSVEHSDRVDSDHSGDRVDSDHSGDRVDSDHSGDSSKH